MTAPYEIAPFLGERRKFALTLEQAELLENSLDVGVFVLEAVFRAQQPRLKHVQKVLTHALIGGGLDEGKAIDLVEQGVRAGAVLRYAELCHLILVNFLGPIDGEDEEDGGKKPEPPQNEGESDTTSDQTDSSPTAE